jgi:NAD+ synthase
MDKRGFLHTKWQLIERYLIAFLQDEVSKAGFQKVVLGISGGIDSAVVAILCHRAFGSGVLGVLMPSQFSSPSSVTDAKQMCETFGISYEIRDIASIMKPYVSNLDDQVRIGNFSARIRMSVLYDISARESALVIGTSNKSELMLGYGTLFGDLASAINPIGDLYKTDIFDFGSYLGVPDSIRTKPPSADLFSGQSDELDLGYSYEKIDALLHAHIQNRMNRHELIESGFDSSMVDALLNRIYKNHFKRTQPIIAKVMDRTLTHDFLYPRDIYLHEGTT